jgi:hypothetical protein
MSLGIALAAASVLAGSGCLVVGAGVAGGAVAGYYYCKGKVCQRYDASFADTWAATQIALTDFGMTIVREERGSSGGSMDARTAQGESVHVTIEPQTPTANGCGHLTRVGFRVGTFGDAPMSEKILEQVGRRLQPANLLRPVETSPPAAVPPQTVPPPLLPPEPERKP